MNRKFSILITTILVLTFILTACGQTPTAAPAAEQPKQEEPAKAEEKPAEEVKPTEAPAPAEEKPAEQPAAEKTKIVFWNGVGAPENVVFSDMVKKYNETNQDNIEVEEVILDWGTLYSKIVLDFKAGTSPDVVTMQQSNIYQNVDLGVLSDITQLAADNGFKKDDFVETAWDGTLIDGKQYAIPYDMHPLALYYNVKLFQEAGLDPNNPPKTKEEFLDAAKKLTKDTNGDGTPDQYGLGLTYSGGIPFRFWMSLLWQHKGADVLSPDRTKADFNNQAGLEALEFMHSLIYTDKVVPEQEQSPDDDFAKGIVAMDISGPWSQFDFNKVEGLEYNTAQLPVFFEQPAAWTNSHTMVMPDTKDDARKAASIKFIKFLSDESLTWTVKAGHLPVKNSILADPEFAKLTKSKAFSDSLATAHYYPSIVKTSEVFGREPNSPFVVLMESTLLNKAKPADALKEVEGMVNDILAQ